MYELTNRPAPCPCDNSRYCCDNRTSLNERDGYKNDEHSDEPAENANRIPPPDGQFLAPRSHSIQPRRNKASNGTAENESNGTHDEH